MNDYELGRQVGYENAIDSALQTMRQTYTEFNQFIGAWNAQKHTDRIARRKANTLGFEVWQAATVANRLIFLLKDAVETRDYTAERKEISEIYEILSSWDLYAQFGWEE